MATVLVTGGGGFIGRKVVSKLVRRGYQVKVYDLVKNKVKGVYSEKIASVLDEFELPKAVRGCDYVIHLAAMMGVERTDANQLECLMVNIKGTVNVLEACLKERVKKILFSSSSEVYGDKEEPITEDSPLNPKSVYAVSKLAAEEYVKAYNKVYGLNYSIVRLFNVYGEDQVAEFVIPRFVRAVREKKPPQVYGTGEQIRTFCHVEDAAEGILLALFKKEGDRQVFNIGRDSEVISMKDLACKVIEVGGLHIKPQFVSLANSDRTEKREVFKRMVNIDKTRQILGYHSSISLDEGIKMLLEYGKVPLGRFDKDY